MAYDKEKAHEYYEKYRKRGLLKGRKKGKGRKKKATAKVKATNLVGIGTGGLNEAGKMQAALVKDNIKAEMNAAMAKAATPEEREQIRQQYQQKALSAVEELRNNPAYAKAKTSSGKSGSGSKSSGSSREDSEGSSKRSSSKNASKKKAAIEAANKTAQKQIQQLVDKISRMNADQKAEAKTKIQDVLKEITEIQDSLKQATKRIKEIYG